MFGEPLRMVPAIVSARAENERSRSESGPRGLRVTRGSGVLVPVAVVQVGIMRVLVHDPRVLVLERLMPVLVLMRLREMQIDPDPLSTAAPMRASVGASPNSGSARAAP